MKASFKKSLCILTSILTLLILCFSFVTQARPGYSGWGIPYPGDMNGDGNVDSTDALIILQWSVNVGTESHSKSIKADVNQDGKLDAQDALMVLQYSIFLFDRFEGYQSVIN